MRMKNKDIKEFREMMVEDQQGICPLCNRRFLYYESQRCMC
jgi:hypothetical protein